MGASGAYVAAAAVELIGDLDCGALRRALNRIVERHESLRTAFPVINGELVQRVYSAEECLFSLAEYDLRGHSLDEFDRRLALEVGVSFDLATGPLIRGCLIRRGDNGHVLILVVHHIVWDGWSNRVFWQEFTRLYAAYSRREPDPLPELPLRYAEYTAWQKKRIESGTLGDQCEKWKTALSGAPTVFELPTPHSRPQEQDYRGAQLDISFEASLTRDLKSFGKRHRATLYMVLLTGWVALLARLAGKSDLVIGTPLANRRRTQFYGLIGMFTNILPLRIDTSGSPRVRELLARVKAVVLFAQDNQDIQQLQEPANHAICVRSGINPSPLFVVHEGTGQISYAVPLASHIDPAIPVYGLPAPPLDKPCPRTMEGMATRMVAMIRSVQPTGPYRVAGWSVGGTLAYEIATQLLGADQHVDFVGLFDSGYIANVNKRPNIADAFDEKESLLELISLQISQEESGRSQRQQGFDAVRAVAATLDFAELLSMCQEQSLLPPHFRATGAEQLRQRLAREQTYQLTAIQYRANPIPIPIHIFAARTGNDPNDPAQSYLGWDAVLPKALIRVIPVSGNHFSMMSPPHIQDLGQALSESIRRAGPSASEREYFPVFTLRSGRRDRPPLFCVPGAGASATAFLELAAQLEDDRAVHGLQPRGLDGELTPHSTVPAAAECCLRAIRQTCTHGPLHLLGHSFGGWVAFSMAQSLAAAGRAVASLTIIDTKVPDDHFGQNREYDNDDVMSEWIDSIEQTLERSLGVRSEALVSLTESAQREILHRCLVEQGLMLRRSDPNALRGPMRVFASSLRTCYRPDAPYTGSLSLVLVDDPKLDSDANRRAREESIDGWRRWAPNLTWVRLPGNHMTVLKHPHVKALAQSVFRTGSV